MSFFDLFKKKNKNAVNNKKPVIDDRKAECPYCLKTLLKAPDSKIKCPHCGNFIFVRTRFQDNVRVVMTEVEANKHDKDRHDNSVAKKFKQNLMCSELFSEEKYLTMKELLTKRFGFTPKEGDILWGLSNDLLKEVMGKNDWWKIKNIYFAQALFLHESGRDCFELLQEVRRCELMEEKKGGYIKKVEISSGGECSCCKKLSGKIYTIDQALKEMPIPVRDCSFKLNKSASTGWCRCCYIPVIDDD